MSGDYVQLEGFNGNITNSISVIFCESSASMWIPHEFLNSGMVTRVLLYGEHSQATRACLATEPWSLVMCMAGSSKNWSILASMCKHMESPVLIAVAPDITIPSAFLAHLGIDTTLLVYRWLSDLGNIGITAHSIFFPMQIQASQIVVAQRSVWKGKALRMSDNNLPLVVQETRPQGLCLVSSVLDEGIVTISWYRPKDSDAVVLKDQRNMLAHWFAVISERIVGLLTG